MGNLLATYLPICSRFWPRSWIPAWWDDQGQVFDFEAAEPLLDPTEGGYADESLNQALVGNLVAPTGCRALCMWAFKIAQVVIQFYAMYLFIVLNIFVFSAEECEEWLYTVAWYLVMLPWIIIGCTCCCSIVCIFCLLALRPTLANAAAQQGNAAPGGAAPANAYQNFEEEP